MFWSSRSPAVRKVMVVAHELGLAHRLTLRRVSVGMALPNPEVMASNPLNKIPTLVLEDGTAIFDSRTICRFLGRAAEPSHSLSGDGAALADIETWEAFGDGLADLSLLLLGERSRPDGARSQPHIDAFKAKMLHCLDYLARELEQLRHGGITLGSISVAAALSHIDFRHDWTQWRTHHAELAEWYDDISRRPSFVETAFSDIV